MSFTVRRTKWALSTGTLLLGLGIVGCQSKTEPWVGQWKITAPNSGTSATLVLNPAQKAYILPAITTMEGNPIAYEIPVERIPNNATLPSNIRLVSLEDLTKGLNQVEIPSPPLEAAAETYVGSITRAQQAYFLERGRFAPDLASLELGLDSEIDGYRYEVVPQDSQHVMITASPLQPELRSYTAVVYISENGSGSILRFACKTNNPSMTAPALPRISSDLAIQPECPLGSSSIGY